MLTAVYSSGHVSGAEVWLAGWWICAAVFFLTGFLHRENRNVVEFGRRLNGLLFAGAIVDIVWFRFYYPDGRYVNHGIAGAYLLLLWPAALVLTALAMKFLKKRTVIHKKRL